MDGINWNYSDKVKEHFMNPHNVLAVPEEEFAPDGVGYVGSPACGDMMKIFIKVKNDLITECKWQTFGCASAIGSTSILSDMVTGMKLDAAFVITPDDIIQKLGGLPANKIHCSVLGDKALREAIIDYYRKTGQINRIPKSAADRVVCKCLNVTEEDIKMQVLEGVKDFSVLQERTKAGTGCGECISEVKVLLHDFVQKYHSEKIYSGTGK